MTTMKTPLELELNLKLSGRVDDSFSIITAAIIFLNQLNVKLSE